MLTIGDSIPAQLVKKTARRGYTFNIMSVGPPEMNKTTLMSALFGKSLDMSPDGDGSEARTKSEAQDPYNPPVTITKKTFEIEEKRVKLKLTLAESEAYGEALCLQGTHKPLVDYIDAQFAEYFRRESTLNRRQIKDNMVHCLFFFISPFGYGLSEFDLQFLEAVHTRVNIIPIIAKAEALTISERIAFKWRVRNDLKDRNINIYQLDSPDLDDSDDCKRVYKDIREAMPFAISSMALQQDSTPAERCLDWGCINPYDLNHSDFLLLKSMLHMQIPDLCEMTNEVFYEDYRLAMMKGDPSGITLGQSHLRSVPKLVGKC